MPAYSFSMQFIYWSLNSSSESEGEKEIKKKKKKKAEKKKRKKAESSDEDSDDDDDDSDSSEDGKPLHLLLSNYILIVFDSLMILLKSLLLWGHC